MDKVEFNAELFSMVEDVKGRGGSGYVVEKEKAVLENWLERNPENHLDAVRR